jgi:hypothetical protein
LWDLTTQQQLGWPMKYAHVDGVFAVGLGQLMTWDSLGTMIFGMLVGPEGTIIDIGRGMLL